jgi:hypothetical protein
MLVVAPHVWKYFPKVFLGAAVIFYMIALMLVFLEDLRPASLRTDSYCILCSAARMEDDDWVGSVNCWSRLLY